jgi:hypothetical protein
MRPTPGKGNGDALTPAPVLSNGGLSRRGHRVEITALVTSICPGELESVVLHYLLGGDWRQREMIIADGQALGRLETEALEDQGELSYFFVARSPDGLERYAPLTAPREVYSGSLGE